MRNGPRQLRTTTRQWCCSVRGDDAMFWYQRQRRKYAPCCHWALAATSIGGITRGAAAFSRLIPSCSRVGSRATVLIIARRIIQSVVMRVNSCSRRVMLRSCRHARRFLRTENDAPYAMRNAARNGRRNWCRPLNATYSSGVIPACNNKLI